MLVNLHKSAVEDAIGAALSRQTTTRTTSFVVNWTKDRWGNETASIEACFDGLRMTIVVEEVDECEWYVFLDGTLPVFTMASGGRPRIQTPEEVDDLVDMMRKAGNLLSAVRTEIAFRAESRSR